MEFSVGDKVVHPRYGAGQITDVEHRELVKGFEHYFVVHLLSQDTTLYIPIRKMEELGVRAVMSSVKFAHVLSALQGAPRGLVKDYKKRQERIQVELSTGLPIRIAEAVRDLTWRGQQKQLTKRDQDLLEQGRELLATEMAVALSAEILDAHKIIDTALEVAIANRLEQPERAQVASVALELISSAYMPLVA